MLLIRNDDLCCSTPLEEIRTLCDIADRYGVRLIHSVTPIGDVRTVHCSMDNATIRRVSGTSLFSENRPLVEYLRGRKRDHFAVHGLWHTHAPSVAEMNAGALLIEAAGFPVRAVVPPFNEGEYDPNELDDRDVLGAGIPRLEEFLEAGDPQSETVYLHSNRFPAPFTWQQLDKCLARLTGRS